MTPRFSMSSVSKLWSREEIQKLRELATAGLPVEAISTMLRRTPSAVRNKAAMHGISVKGSTGSTGDANANAAPRYGGIGSI